MDTPNNIALPVFFTIDECFASGIDPTDLALLELSGHTIVPVTELAGTSDPDLISEEVTLEPGARINILGYGDSGRRIDWQYTPLQLEVILSIAEEHNIRALDAFAYIVGRVFPDLGIVDSAKSSITTLDALPRNTGGHDQRSLHGVSNLPLNVLPPAWFPKAGMPNVSFSFVR